MATSKEKLVNFRASEEFTAHLAIAAEILDRPAAQIIREAVSEKINQLSQVNPKLAKALKAA